MAWLRSRRVAVAVAVAVAGCGGGEFSAVSGGSAGGANGGAGSGGHTGAAGASTVGAGGSSGAMDAASDLGGTGGQASDDATTTRDAVPDGTSSDGSTRDALPSDVNVTTQCPPIEPSVNTPCADGLDCTYGTHPRPACRTEYICSGSHWSPTPGLLCPPLGDCFNEQPKPQVGATCAIPQHDCIWSTGLYCGCLPGPDGGSPTWDCFPPSPDCPITPPNKGQACDLTAMTCAYGTCPLGTKVTTSCVGGTVRWTFPACP